jgi:hypothetical protein
MHQAELSREGITIANALIADVLAVPKAGILQSTQLAAAVVESLAPGERLLAPPATFADIPSLLAAIQAAGFQSLECRYDM